MSEVLLLRDDRESAMERAAAVLRAGELVVLPTDTVYGLGADAFNAGATARIFDLKARARSSPLPVLVARPRQAWALTSSPPPEAAELVAAFWPGALTLVLPVTEIAWDLGDARGGVAMRMPDHPATLELVAAVGPLAVTSANRSGEPTPGTVEEVRARFGDEVALYLDDGPAAAGVPSTVVDLTGPKPRILREGAIARAEIERVLGRRVKRKR